MGDGGGWFKPRLARNKKVLSRFTENKTVLWPCRGLFVLDEILAEIKLPFPLVSALQSVLII